MLNRLRTGDLIESDSAIFESRIVRRTDDDYISNARHFFPLNKTTRNHNDNIYATAVSEKLDIHALDFVTGNPSEKVKQKTKLCIATSPKYFEKHGLLSFKGWCRIRIHDINKHQDR